MTKYVRCVFETEIGDKDSDEEILEKIHSHIDYTDVDMDSVEIHDKPYVTKVERSLDSAPEMLDEIIGFLMDQADIWSNPPFGLIDEHPYMEVNVKDVHKYIDFLQYVREKVSEKFQLSD